MSVHMEFDWVETSPSTDLLAQSTMAALTIGIDGHVVTSVLDHRSRSVRKHVVVPLITVAEWLVGNWWRIFHEVDDERPRDGFAEAHDLSFAGDGFLLPRLTIAPTPQQMRLRWEKNRPAYGEIEFVAQGEAHVDRQDLEDAIHSVVDATQDRLAGAGLKADFLQQDWAAIQAADQEEVEFCRAAALVGTDPFAVPQPQAAQIIEFWQRTEPSIREDALATANGVDLAHLSDWLTDALARVGAVRDGTNWLEVRKALPTRTTQRPYERGYELARAVRAVLAPCSPRYEFAAAGADAVRSVEVPPPTRRIQGVVAAETPACAMRAGGNRERFLQGRALGDYLDRTQSQPAILSGLATNRQAHSRAFAAEFLAPSDWLRGKVQGHVSADEIDELAEEVGVSAYVIRHQIANHGLATLSAW